MISLSQKSVIIDMHMQVMLSGDDMAVMTGATPQTRVEIVDSDSEQLHCVCYFICSVILFVK